MPARRGSSPCRRPASAGPPWIVPAPTRHTPRPRPRCRAREEGGRAQEEGAHCAQRKVVAAGRGRDGWDAVQCVAGRTLDRELRKASPTEPSSADCAARSGWARARVRERAGGAASAGEGCGERVGDRAGEVINWNQSMHSAPFEHAVLGDGSEIVTCRLLVSGLC